MISNEEIDYKLAAEQLHCRQPLFGKDSALPSMLERILNVALEGEMDAYLSAESRESGNRRNGRMSKTVQTQYGEVRVDTPCDRDGSFDPQTVRNKGNDKCDSTVVYRHRPEIILCVGGMRGQGT